MTERSDPPAPQDAGCQGAGWRAIGPGRVERRIPLDEPAAQELFLELLERVARLSGFPGETRIQGGEVVVRADRDRKAQEPHLDLILRLDLDPADRTDP